MKKIVILTLSLFLVFNTTLSYNSVLMIGVNNAQAQAVDHDVILAALYKMKQGINKMIALVQRHKIENVTIGNQTIVLTTAQKAQIIAAYGDLKTQLATDYALLP